MKHLKLHTVKKKSHVCGICGRIFTDIRGLRLHERKHNDGKYKNDCLEIKPNIECQDDIKDTEQDLSQQQNNIHTGNSQFTCYICGHAFAQQIQLQTHVLVHVQTENKPYKCETCGKAFSQRTYLKSHLKVHSEDKLYVCKICGKEFSWVSNLKQHLKSHTKEKACKCNVCGREFYRTDYLMKHTLRVHIGEKPYTCLVLFV